jgi:hypothetical protein
MKSIFIKASIVLLIGSLTACSSNSSEIDKTGKEYTSAYVCPMHCEGSGNNSAGTCPVCGMDYIVNDQHKH